MNNRLRENLEWQKLLDGLNDVKVSKGMFGCLDTRHHLDEGQFLTTTDTPTLSCAEPVEGKSKERIWQEIF